MSFPAKLVVGGAPVDVTVTHVVRGGAPVAVTLGNPTGPPPPPPPVAGAPTAPTNVKVAITSDTALTVSWSAAAVPAGSPAVTGYKVSNASTGAVLKTVGNVLNASFTGLTPGTTYSYTVVASNSVGDSQPSAAGSGTTTKSAVVPARLLGMYNGGPTTDDAIQTSFGNYPDISSTYYAANQQAFALTGETGRINKGISPLITLSSTGTQHIAGIANGTAADLTWLDQYVTQLGKLALINPKVPVYATLDHEFEVKVNQATITGASANETLYGKALSLFFEKCKANAPGVVYGYWCGGSDTAAITTVMTNLTTAPKWIAQDPYTTNSHSPTERPSGLWKTKTDWFRTGGGAAQYARLGKPPLALGEFGIDVRLGDANVGAYYTDLRSVMVSLDLLFALQFNRTKVDANGVGVEYQFNTGAYPKGVAAFTASLAAA